VCNPPGILCVPISPSRGCGTPARASLSAVGNRFPSNNFKFFSLSLQSSLHLSLAVLVCYRSPTAYLALGGVYHPPTGCTPKQPDSPTASLSRSPVCLHPPRSPSHGNFTLFVRTLPGDLGRCCTRPRARLQATIPDDRVSTLAGACPSRAVHPGFQAWAFPCSLAVTKGITVVFFSSAY